MRIVCAILLGLVASGCKKHTTPTPQHRSTHQLSQPSGAVRWLHPVNARQVVTNRFGGGPTTVALEDLDRGTIWRKRLYPVVGSTVGDGIVTLRYHEPGIDTPTVEYGTVAFALDTGKELWHYRAPQDRLKSSLYEIGFSRHRGDQLFERFNNAKRHAVIVSLQRRTGRVLWEYVLPDRNADPKILHIDRSLLIVGSKNRRWIVLERATGKQLFWWTSWTSELAGHCVTGTHFWFLQEDGLHRFALKTRRATLVNPGFWAENGGLKPQRLIACGAFRGQLLLVLGQKQTKVIELHSQRFSVFGLNADGKRISWRIPLGRWEPMVGFSRLSHASSPLIGEQSRFVPFVAQYTGDSKGNRRMMIVDLQTHRVAATGAVREKLLNWHSAGHANGAYLFARFNTLALFSGATGKLIAGVKCPGYGMSFTVSSAGTTWLCGGKAAKGRLSARASATLKPVTGRLNTLDLRDVGPLLGTFFGLKAASR